MYMMVSNDSGVSILATIVSYKWSKSCYTILFLLADGDGWTTREHWSVHLIFPADQYQISQVTRVSKIIIVTLLSKEAKDLLLAKAWLSDLYKNPF